MPKIYKFENKEVSKENILSKVTEQQIYEFYLGEDISFSKKVSAPFRQDNNPSLSFLLTTKGNILWRDWGDVTMDRSAGVIDFVIRVKGCLFTNALHYINIDMNLGLEGSDNLLKNYVPEVIPIPKKRDVSKPNTEKIIEIEPRHFDSFDIGYWGSYGIELSTLATYDVRPIKRCWIDNMLVRSHVVENPSYAYRFERDYLDIKYKIYTPLGLPRTKWLGNAGKEIIQGEDQLTFKGEFLIITKSLKDVMVLSEMGIDAIAPQSESIFINKDDVEQYINWYGGKVYILYDNDEFGYTLSQKFSKQYSIPAIYIPMEFNSKDISDMAREYSLDRAKHTINSLIENEKIYNNLQDDESF